MDIQKVEKLLMLSQSENDHEALSAVRQANAMLKADGKTWAEVISPQNSTMLGLDPGTYRRWKDEAPLRARALSELDAMLNDYMQDSDSKSRRIAAQIRKVRDMGT